MELTHRLYGLRQHVLMRRAASGLHLLYLTVSGETQSSNRMVLMVV